MAGNSKLALCPANYLELKLELVFQQFMHKPRLACPTCAIVVTRDFEEVPAYTHVRNNTTNVTSDFSPIVGFVDLNKLERGI